MQTQHEESGLKATDNPDWGEGFRSHVEALIQKLEEAADTLGAGMLPMLKGGLCVEFYGGKGFSLTFNSEGMPNVTREQSGFKPDPGLWILCEMWALEAMLDSDNDSLTIDEDFFVMAGFEIEGDFELLSRIDKLSENKGSGLSGRLNLMIGN